MLFLKLSVFRAVEFFIRDKYEKKKYYDKNAIAITNKDKEKKKKGREKERKGARKAYKTSYN